jgi:hypothetical protein
MSFITVGGAETALAPAEMARLKYVAMMGAGVGLALGILFVKLRLIFILGVGIGFAAGAAANRQ